MIKDAKQAGGITKTSVAPIFDPSAAKELTMAIVPNHGRNSPRAFLGDRRNTELAGRFIPRMELK